MIIYRPLLRFRSKDLEQNNIHISKNVDT
jgi:hypothetical protein